MENCKAVELWEENGIIYKSFLIWTQSKAVGMGRHMIEEVTKSSEPSDSIWHMEVETSNA